MEKLSCGFDTFLWMVAATLPALIQEYLKEVGSTHMVVTVCSPLCALLLLLFYLCSIIEGEKEYIYTEKVNRAYMQ